MNIPPEVVAAPTSRDDLSWAWDALRGVVDPELGLDIVSLGLVYDVLVEADTLVAYMTLTTPGCPAAESLPAMARAALEHANDGASCDVRLVWDPPWDLSMIDKDAAMNAGFRIARR